MAISISMTISNSKTHPPPLWTSVLLCVTLWYNPKAMAISMAMAISNSKTQKLKTKHPPL